MTLLSPFPSIPKLLPLIYISTSKPFSYRMQQAPEFLNPPLVVQDPVPTPADVVNTQPGENHQSWRVPPPESIVFYQTYGSQFGTDWPDSVSPLRVRGKWNTTNWRIRSEDPGSSVVPPSGPPEPELPNTDERLEKVRWTIKRDSELLGHDLERPANSRGSSADGYDWHDPESWKDEQGTEDSPGIHKPAGNENTPLQDGNLTNKKTPAGPKLVGAVRSTVSASSRVPKPVPRPSDPYCIPVPIENVTIGVELEFIITDIPPGPVRQLFNRVAQALKPLATKLNTSVVSGESQLNVNSRERLKAFQVHSDLSIRTEENKAILQQTQNWRTGGLRTAKGVEIATPILRHRQWESVIPEMAQIVREGFNVAFNGSTGLHVHVGIGREYQLQDLRRIAKAIVLFETAMDKYHPVCRNPSTPEMNSHILACRDSLPLKGLSDIEMMRKLDSVQETYDLFSMMQSVVSLTLYSPTSYHRGYRYNLTSVYRYNTVEFRQAVGTTDGHKIVEWIDMTIKFVTSAIATPDEVFNEWGAAGILDPAVYRQFGVPPPGGD